MKKLLLSLGASSLLLLPVASVVSCDLPKQEKDLGISLTSDQRTVTAETIQIASDNYNAAKDDTTRASSLSQVFMGITILNINEFKVKAIGTSITLTAIDGYKFGAGKTLVANPSPIPSIALGISLSTGITQANIDQTGINFKKAETLAEMAVALNETIFTGVTEANLNNILPEVSSKETTPGSGVMVWSITLVAKPTYYFTDANQTILVATPTV